MSKFEVLTPGLQTTVQDLPGRTGFWDVGVPPSGAWDELSFALADLAVGNEMWAAGLEAVMTGPSLRFAARALVCVTGAAFAATIDGAPLAPGVVGVVPAGGVLDVGPCGPPGMRAYVAVAGGIEVPAELGSRSTFLLGQFGGFAGRALAAGDVLSVGSTENQSAPMDVAPILPALTTDWTLRVLAGPHGAPVHLTPAGVEQFFAATWTVDHRADRTGIRLVGPRPGWARTDGGEAGLHPSNLHDSAYPVGGIMLAGDTPVVVGPDGPSLGGFVVPAVVIDADRWMLGQLRPGDTVHLAPVAPETAAAARTQRDDLLAHPRWAVAELFERSLGRAAGTTGRNNGRDHVGPARGGVAGVVGGTSGGGVRGAGAMGGVAEVVGGTSGGGVRGAGAMGGVAGVVGGTSGGGVRGAGAMGGEVSSSPINLVELPAEGHMPGVRIRRAGDTHLLLEAGPAVLDLTVRMWVHLLAEALRASGLPVLELVEGVRSMLVKVDPRVLPLEVLAGRLAELASQVLDPAGVTLDVREVTLPIAFDHPLAHEAMARYMRGVRPDAPWGPDNVEFIRRINDLGERGEVFETIAKATYLVVGLGDVYLGAPVAVPIDPRHRLVTTKYDPARTWTPQNAVGIGGVYLCVYGMEGPGGYQLVGRTVPVWRLIPGSGENPWLLRQFDRLRFTAVTVEELADRRADIKAGRAGLDTKPAVFSLAEERALLDEHAEEIRTFRTRRESAFAAERARWDAAR